uniref:Lysophospholipid acyltransferase 5 n=1 Tax=Strigamia maritima TaxID=126957 RepID=T1J0V7_STRMM
MEDLPVRSILGSLAASVGASEPALRLLISILLGYPLALLHRYTLFGKDAVYLLVGYYYTGTENYDITWSMPHCVLTLRLIGLTFDVYDGHRDESKLSPDQKKTALTKVPSLLEIASHTYFFGGFMVGPQFPMRRYIDFIDGSFVNKNVDELPACLGAGFLRGGAGALYLLLYQVATIFLPDTFIVSDAYMLMPFYKRLLILGIWGKIQLYKYISCWLIAEGSCTLTGLTYNGKDDNGNNLWDGCANFKVRIYEGSTTFAELIQSFNINTNLWVAQYVFKRLKFLGIKLLSQAAALFFLAAWHGLHSGYYMCFFLEFTVMKFERDLTLIIERIPILCKFVHASAMKPIKWIFLKIFVVIFMGYCLVPFVFLKRYKWMQVYGSIYYIGHCIYIGWFILSPFVFKLLKPYFKTEKKD